MDILSFVYKDFFDRFSSRLLGHDNINGCWANGGSVSILRHHSFYRTHTNNARSRETFFASNFLSHSTNNNRHSSILYFPENKFSEYRETAHHINH